MQELVKTKQVIVGKVDGKQSPADILTKHLDTGDEVRNGVELGWVGLTQEGFGGNVGKAHMKKVEQCSQRSVTRQGNSIHTWAEG